MIMGRSNAQIRPLASFTVGNDAPRDYALVPAMPALTLTSTCSTAHQVGSSSEESKNGQQR